MLFSFFETLPFLKFCFDAVCLRFWMDGLEIKFLIL